VNDVRPTDPSHPSDEQCPSDGQRPSGPRHPADGDGPRIAPGGRREVGLLTWLFSGAAGLLTGTGPPALFLTLGKHRRLFRGWLMFAGRLMPGGRLPRRETELVILRVAQLCDCAYEFEHHRLLARRARIGHRDVARVVSGPDAEGWSPRERALLTAADALHHTRDLDDETWQRLRDHLDEPTAIEFLLLVGHYEMLATTIGTLRLTPDPPRRGITSRSRAKP
jgi:AhpD family alkylhydroperoxidase